MIETWIVFGRVRPRLVQSRKVMFMLVLRVMVPHGFQRILIDELGSAALQTKSSWNLLTSICETTMILAVTSYQLLVIRF
jgi:hypothetical protein